MKLGQWVKCEQIHNTFISKSLFWPIFDGAHYKGKHVKIKLSYFVIFLLHLLATWSEKSSGKAEECSDNTCLCVVTSQRWNITGTLEKSPQGRIATLNPFDLSGSNPIKNQLHSVKDTASCAQQHNKSKLKLTRFTSEKINQHQRKNTAVLSGPELVPRLRDWGLSRSLSGQRSIDSISTFNSWCPHLAYWLLLKGTVTHW